jgi:hypothetical protein
LNWPERRIARETGFHWATIRRIALEAAADLSKCTSPGEVATDPKPAKVATDPNCTRPPEAPTDSPRSRSGCEPYRSFIEAEAAKGRNAVAIYQDLVDGYPGAYNAVKRFVGKLRPRDPKISCRSDIDLGQDYVEYRVMLRFADGAREGTDSSVVRIERFT